MVEVFRGSIRDGVVWEIYNDADLLKEVERKIEFAVLHSTIQK